MKKAMIAVIAGILLVAVGLGVFLMAGLTGGLSGFTFNAFDEELVNRQTFTASSLEDISVEYSFESVQLFATGGNEVVLEEYMNQDEEELKARIDNSGGRLSISHGQRPISIGLFGLRASVKLYLPESWAGKLRLSTSSGSIRSEDDFSSLKALEARASSGSVRLDEIETTGDILLSASSGSLSARRLAAGGSIRLEASSGSVRPGEVTAGGDIYASCSSGSVDFESAVAKTVEAKANSGGVRFGRLEGEFRLSSSSGGVKVDAGAGHGQAETSSGGVRMALDQLTGDLNLKTTSGSCRLTLPQDASFTIQASTTSGGIKLPQGQVEYNEKKNQASGSFGSGAHSVMMKASSGGVRLEWR